MTASLRVRLVGLSCAIAVFAIVIAVPWWLKSSFGWPYSGHLPGASEVWRGLGRPLTDELVGRGLVIAVWLAWAWWLALPVIIEAGATALRLEAPQLPLAGAAQALATELVAGALLLAAPWQAANRPGAVPTRSAPIAAVHEPANGRPATSRIEVHDTIEPPEVDPTAEPLGEWYRVLPDDNPWKLAATWYGRGEYATQLWNANAMRRMPNGRIYSRPGLIRPGDALFRPSPETVGAYTSMDAPIALRSRALDPPSSDPERDRRPSAAIPGGWDDVIIKPRDRLWQIVAARWPNLSNARIAEVVSAIEAKNMRRPQPSYGEFLDIDETHPGWTILFPSSVSPVIGDPVPTPFPDAADAADAPDAPDAADAADAADADPSRAAPAAEPPAAHDPPAEPTTTAAEHVPETSPPTSAPSHDGHRKNRASGRVRLPGVDVDVGLAIAVAGTLAIVRINRRRARRPRRPTPGLSPESPLREPLQELVAAVSAIDGSAGDPVVDAALPIGGVRGGVRVVGQEAEPVGCALVVGRLQAGAADDLRVLVDRDAAQHLLGATGSFPGFEVLSTAASVLDEAEIERARRSRILGESMDIADYREGDGDELFADVLVVGSPTPADAGRWAALAAAGARLGIDVLMIEGCEAGGSVLQVDGDGVVVAAGLRELLGRRLDRMAPAAASVILDEVAEARRGPEALESTETPADAPFSFEDLDVASPPGATSPVAASLFGAVAVTAPARDASGTVRERGRDLLVYLMLHPGPQRRDAIIVELWPDADFERGKFAFHHAVRSLREDVRAVLGVDDVAVVETASIESDRNSGAVYQLQAGLFDSDLWRFKRALRAAEEADDPAKRLAAYKEASDMYGGEFVDGAEAHWIIREREWLRGKAVDVAAAIADLEVEAGNPEGALAAVQRGTVADPYAEDLYVRGVQLLAGLGRIDAARKLSADLQRQLGELGVPMTTSRDAIGRAISDAERRRSAREALERKREVAPAPPDDAGAARA